MNILQSIRLIKLKQNLKRYGDYGIKTSDRLKCVIRDINTIQKTLNITFCDIKDDDTEQSIFLAVIENNFHFLCEQANKYRFTSYIQEQNIISLDKMSIKSNSISFYGTDTSKKARK